MNMIYVLIPLAVVLVAVGVWALVWAIRTGQFDDLDAQGWSVVLDDDEKPPESPGCAGSAEKDGPGSEAGGAGTGDERR